MRKALIALLLVVGIVSCNKAQEQPDTNAQQEQVVDTTIYDAWDADPSTYYQEEEDSQGSIEWVWDGSPYDTIHIGDNLRITNIDGDKVYITLSK
jgi:hypothetical protein